jgi:hypothetical protein
MKVVLHAQVHGIQMVQEGSKRGIGFLEVNTRLRCRSLGVCIPLRMLVAISSIDIFTGVSSLVLYAGHFEGCE